MAITIAIGLGLKNINKASYQVNKENFMIQTTVILDDVLTLLETYPELDAIAKDNSGDAFGIFLSQASFIPLESGDLKIAIELKSARSKFNVNSLFKNNNIQEIRRVDALKNYLSKYMINDAYVDILLDNMGGIKEYLPYNSEIFYENPKLFRDYIQTSRHLADINQYYLNRYADNSIMKKSDEYTQYADIEELFYYSKDRNTSIDLNYATVQTWELLLSTSRERAQELSGGAGTYTAEADLELQDDEKLEFVKFSTSFYEPFIDVSIEIIKEDQSAMIYFEYDIKKKKGYNFAYDI